MSLYSTVKVNTSGSGIGNQKPREGARRSVRLGNNLASVFGWQMLDSSILKVFFVFSVSPW